MNFFPDFKIWSKFNICSWIWKMFSISINFPTFRNVQNFKHWTWTKFFTTFKIHFTNFIKIAGFKNCTWISENILNSKNVHEYEKCSHPPKMLRNLNKLFMSLKNDPKLKTNINWKIPGFQGSFEFQNTFLNFQKVPVFLKILLNSKNYFDFRKKCEFEKCSQIRINTSQNNFLKPLSKRK